MISMVSMVKLRMSPALIGSCEMHLRNIPPGLIFFNTPMPAKDLLESGEWIRYEIDKSTFTLGYLRLSMPEPNYFFKNLFLRSQDLVLIYSRMAWGPQK